MPLNIETRLRRIETARRPRGAALPCTMIACENDEDRERQLAEREAAGTYKPGWPLIAWRITDPATYKRPEPAQTKL